MKSKFNIIIVILIFFKVMLSFGQQDPQYTQYMYNMNVINPAYATDDNDIINFGLMYRSQWVGAVGSPTTGSLFAHSKFGSNLEGGVSIVHDQIGDVVKDTNIFFDAAYVFQVSDNTKLSLGIKAGLSFFSTNFNGFVYSDPLPDPAFAENISRTFPNFGGGAYYFSDKFYLGLSAPNLLQTKHLEDDSGIVTEGVEEIHFFATGGYVFDINEKLKLKPAFMTKAVSGAPLSVDITANALFNEQFELGVAYRFEDGISGLFNIKVAQSLRIGYAYDYTVSNLGRFNSGTHEIMLLFDLSKKENGYDKSPRFF